MVTVALTNKTDCWIELVKTESRERSRSKIRKVMKIYRRPPKNAENEAGTSKVCQNVCKHWFYWSLTPDIGIPNSGNERNISFLTVNVCENIQTFTRNLVPRSHSCCRRKRLRIRKIKIVATYLNSALTLVDEKRVIGHLITGFLRKVGISSLLSFFLCLFCFLVCFWVSRHFSQAQVFSRGWNSFWALIWSIPHWWHRDQCRDWLLLARENSNRVTTNQGLTSIRKSIIIFYTLKDTL